jgi:5-methylcytosine-specific restriction endonuclease McrA
MAKMTVKARKRVMQDLIHDHGRECFYCGEDITETAVDDPRKGMTLEHLLSRHHGGSNHIANLVLAHNQCNTIAGHRTMLQKFQLRELMRLL